MLNGARYMPIKNGKLYRSKINGTSERPRLNIFNTTDDIYVQIIDDEKDITLLVSRSPLKYFHSKEQIIKAGKLIGAAVANTLIANGTNKMILDIDCDCVFHGYIKTLTNSARENGIKFT